ncbi:MAG: hypothetical protein EXS18_03395 [Verrucomicrobiae bacterium]|nr:hypothetical protein [Verrucomicrobiae bacterium]
MSETRRVWYRSLIPVGLFTAKGLLLRAALIAIAFLVCHALGLREYTSIICGQSLTGNVADKLPTALGCIYLVLYFLFVLVVPIMVIAVGLIFVGEKWMKRNSVERGS